LKNRPKSATTAVRGALVVAIATLAVFVSARASAATATGADPTKPGRSSAADARAGKGTKVVARDAGTRPAASAAAIAPRKSGARSAPATARAAKYTQVAPVRSGGRFIRAGYAPRAVEPARLSIGQAIGLHLVDDPLDLKSSVAVVIDQLTGETLYQKNPEAVLPIASITKVMTAMVVLDAGLPMGELLEVTEADRDLERHSSSRLRIGAQLPRSAMMQLALMSSENRAAHALGRNYPGGLTAFVAAMNRKAQDLGMADSRFADPTGLSGNNVSNARDLARMVRAAYGYPEIREFSTATDIALDTGLRRPTMFRSTNRLVDSPDWDIGMQKTGYISEAGKCLVMQARVDDRPLIIVLLDAAGSQSRFADAQRIRRWVETQPRTPVPTVRASTQS
jgi:D-alanyl-D-alanine endopeptidase (penicillin-binding protein 7)